MTNCLVCHQEMDPALAPEVTHPTCAETSFWHSEQDITDSFNAILKQQLIGIALWAENESPRSKQEMIGPSEIGAVCRRQIAYRLSGLPRVNLHFDPWPAIVGTAVHAWLEKAVKAYQAAHQDDSFQVERTLTIDSFILGHSDLYWGPERTVIDWKTTGPGVMQKIRDHGPPSHYEAQIQVYGLGYRQLGYEVDRVALAFLPRSGWLRDMYIWSTPYDEAAAQTAVSRVYEIAQEAVDLDVLTRSHRWEQIEATPSDICGYCPWFNSTLTSEQGASDKGCPAT